MDGRSSADPFHLQMTVAAERADGQHHQVLLEAMGGRTTSSRASGSDRGHSASGAGEGDVPVCSADKIALPLDAARGRRPREGRRRGRACRPGPTPQYAESGCRPQWHIGGLALGVFSVRVRQGRVGQPQYADSGCWHADAGGLPQSSETESSKPINIQGKEKKRQQFPCCL